MRYRSYNSELLIAATMVCDVFNDIIIDRRKHGLSRDWSKAVTLKDIVQQKIEVPCIIRRQRANPQVIRELYSKIQAAFGTKKP